MKRYLVTIDVGTVEADSIEEAAHAAEELLTSYAESNDGSELLANAIPVLRDVTK